MVNASDSGPRCRGSSPTRVKPCYVLEQGAFTPLKILVIPRKRWLRSNMTEKLFTGTLRVNQPTNHLPPISGISSLLPSSVAVQCSLCPANPKTDFLLTSSYEPRHDKTCLLGFRPGPTQIGLYSHRKWLEA